jgi:hypothetical protein
MLEAAYADLAFIISLKRSTLIFSYPQAGRPITPSFGERAVMPAGIFCNTRQKSAFL